MDLDQLKNLTRKGESHSLEFKTKIARPERVVREIVAFANADGGELLIGVNDNGEIRGLKYPEDEMFLLESTIRQHVRPRVRYRSNLIRVSNKRSVLQYTVPESRHKPHFILQDGVKRAYTRIEDRSVKISREMIAILKGKKRKNGIYFNYGKSEQKLLQYLNEYNRITLPEFVQVADINRKQASSTLVRLVLANVLTIQPGEGEDVYMANTVI